MDFFEAQDEARKKTRQLLGLFLLCVGGVIVAVCLLLCLIFFFWNPNHHEALASDLSNILELVPLDQIAFTAIGTALLIFIASGYKALQLRGGGGVVARDLGGRLLDRSTTETTERRLLNIVEEMAIASGVPVPQVYVMDNESGINAFAAGTEPGNAAIGVTRGCMAQLTRAELQGVIAHEFAHILNGDMKLNMRLIGWVFGLVVISIMGRGILESLRFVRVRGSNRENNGGGIALAILVIGIGLLAIGAIGVFFARILQSAISRQREYLADASAVQFTREASGLAGALKKIGGSGSKIESSKASEASHCFFADGGLFAYGLATHPPLNLRIKRLEADWNGHFEEGQLPPIGDQAKAASNAISSSLQAGGGEQLPVSGFAAGAAMSSPERVNYTTGQRILEEIPEEWKEAVHHRAEGQALIFGLLLAEDQALRQGEVDFLQEHVGQGAATLALRWQEQLGASHSACKIALIDLAIPTLRALSREEYDRFSKITRDLVASDGNVDLFEYMLQRLIAHHLEGHFAHRGVRKIRYHHLHQLAQEALILTSAFAYLAPDSAKAFKQGIKGWSFTGELLAPEFIKLKQIDEALQKLEAAAPLVKRDLLLGCCQVVASDGELLSHEAELLRAMADSIGCGIPPWIDELKQA